jgi:hypothetical protein
MLSGTPPCFTSLPVYKKLSFEFRRRLSRVLGWQEQRFHQKLKLKFTCNVRAK